MLKISLFWLFLDSSMYSVALKGYQCFLFLSYSITQIIPNILYLFFLIGCNSFFVAAELSIVKVRRTEIDILIEQGNKRAIVTKNIILNIEHYISATQLGITLSSLALGWFGQPFIASSIRVSLSYFIRLPNALIETVAVIIAFASITFLHILLGELIPKSIAIHQPAKIALSITPLLRLFYILFRPIILFLNLAAHYFIYYVLQINDNRMTEKKLTTEELRVILTETCCSSSSLASQLASNALNLSDRVVHSIMTPRSEVIYFDLEKPFSEELNKVILSKHTRFPICDGALDRSNGLVHIKDILNLVESKNNNIQHIKRPIHHVSEMMSLEKLLNYFLSKHAHLAVVVDEYGDSSGIVTLDNVLEQLVGSMHDELHDAQEDEIITVGEGEFVSEGACPLHDISQKTGIKFDDTEVSTIGGYITQKLGHLPNRSESINISEYLVTVLETDPRRILKVHFKKVA